MISAIKPFLSLFLLLTTIFCVAKFYLLKRFEPHVIYAHNVFLQGIFFGLFFLSIIILFQFFILTLFVRST